MRRFQPLLFLSAFAFPAGIADVASAEVDDRNHTLTVEAVTQLSMEEAASLTYGSGMPGGSGIRAAADSRALIREWTQG